MNSKESLLKEIERLKLKKPPNWKRDAMATLRVLQKVISEDEFREVFVNGDRQGYEQVGRKARSTRISPPF